MDTQGRFLSRSSTWVVALAGLLATSACDSSIFGGYAHEQTFNVVGTVVRESDGAPAAGATVRLSGGPGRSFGVLSGETRARADPSGSYRLRVRVGFDWFRDHLQVRPCGFSLQATHPDWGRSQSVAVPCTEAEQTIDLSLETPE